MTCSKFPAGWWACTPKSSETFLFIGSFCSYGALVLLEPNWMLRVLDQTLRRGRATSGCTTHRIGGFRSGLAKTDWYFEFAGHGQFQQCVQVGQFAAIKFVER